MKKVLIHIGASELQIESLKWAKEAGLYVVATDKNKYAAGRDLADEFHCISGSDVQLLVDLAIMLNKSNKVVGAYCSNDFGLMAVAAINSTLNLKGCLKKSAELSMHKSRAKEPMRKAGVSVPKGIIINISSKNSINTSNLKWPLIVKPVDSCGSQGVELVTDDNELKNAVSNARHFSNQVMVEEFFNGVGIDTIGFMKDSVFYPCGIEQRIFSDFPYQFPLYGFSPPNITEVEIKEAYKITQNASIALDIENGPVKADLLFHDGKFVLLELTPRFHGDVFTSMLIPEVYGTSPIFDLFTDMASEEPIVFRDYNKIKTLTVLWRALFPKIKGIDYDDIESRIKSRWKINKMFVDKREKVIVAKHTDNTGVAGFVFVELESNKQVDPFNDWFKNEFKEELI